MSQNKWKEISVTKRVTKCDLCKSDDPVVLALQKREETIKEALTMIEKFLVVGEELHSLNTLEGGITFTVKVHITNVEEDTE